MNYDAIMRELMVALGAALFLGNVLALSKRRSDAQQVARTTIASRRPGSPVRGYKVGDGPQDLPQAPVARSVLYAAIGLVVMIWGIASLAM